MMDLGIGVIVFVIGFIAGGIIIARMMTGRWFQFQR